MFYIIIGCFNNIHKHKRVGESIIWTSSLQQTVQKNQFVEKNQTSLYSLRL